MALFNLVCLTKKRGMVGRSLSQVLDGNFIKQRNSILVTKGTVQPSKDPEVPCCSR